MSRMSRGERVFILILAMLLSTLILFGVFFVGTLITVFTFDNPSRTMNPDLIINFEVSGLALVAIGSWILIAFKLFPPENNSHLPSRMGVTGIVLGILSFSVGIIMALSFN